MYTCSSQTLVHLPALRCFRWSAMLWFSFLFFQHSSRNFLFIFFGFFVSLFLLIWLIWVSDVCLCSLSLRWWCVHTLLSLWVVAERSPGAFAALWARLWDLMLCDHSTEQFDPLVSVCCGGHSLWSVLFFLEAALFLFFPNREHNKRLLSNSPNWSWTQLPIGVLLLALQFRGKGILLLFSDVALLSLSHAVNESEGERCRCGSVWCRTGLDQTVGEKGGQRSVCRKGFTDA